MNTLLIGIVALGVGVVGLLAHGARFFTSRTVSLWALWVLAPLMGAMVAFLVSPPDLLTVALGGVSAVLAFLTLAATIVVPALVESPPVERSGRARQEDRAA